MTARRPTVAILLHPDQDPVVWAERHARAQTLDRTPYGYERAADEFDLVWGRAQPETRFGRALRRRTLRWLGFDLLHAWRNRRIVLRADVIWTHTEREHLAIAAIQFFRPPRRRVPVVAQSVWLWDAWTGYGALRRRLVAALLRTHPVELVHSRLNLADSLAAVPGRRVLLVPFGSADAGVEGPAEAVRADRPLVLAVGNDRDRDWALLADVARGLPEADFRIASSSRAARELAWPSNAVVAPATTVHELRDLYLSAAAVTIPLRPNRHASGATVCVEALASGARIVATRAGGLDDYLGGEGRLVAPGDVAGFAAAVREAVREEAPTTERNSHVRLGLTQVDYVARYAAVTRAILGTADWDPAVSRFAPMTQP